MSQMRVYKRIPIGVSVKAIIKYAQNATKLVLLAAFFIILPLFASATLSCGHRFATHQGLDFGKSFRALPKRGSALYLKTAGDLARQIQQTNAYAILDLRPFFSEADGLSWANSIARDVESQILNGKILYVRNGNLIHERPHPWQNEGVENLQTWLRELIQDVLPGTELGKGFANVRKATKEGLGIVFDEWHVDGGRASVTLAVEGMGTEILGAAPLNMSIQEYHGVRGKNWEDHCPGCESKILPAGFALIFFGSSSGASGQFAPTIHRTPKNAGSRTLFVIRY